MSLDLSIVIACYRDAPHLFQNVHAIAKYMQATKRSFELVFIEDASMDQTAEAVRRCLEWCEVEGISTQSFFHKENQGRGASVTEGLRASRGTLAMYLDIDLENLLDPLISMILMVESGDVDVVVGQRVQIAPWRNLVRAFTSLAYRTLVQAALPMPVSDSECGFKVFNRAKILPVLDHVEDRRWFWDTEVVHCAARRGLVVKEHPVVFLRKSEKISTVRLIPDSIAYLKAIAAYKSRLKTNA